LFWSTVLSENPGLLNGELLVGQNALILQLSELLELLDDVRLGADAYAGAASEYWA